MKMSEVSTVKGVTPHSDVEMSGWLFKWTNYLKGYQKRWFVLQNGLLSYYRNQAEMAHTCRGNISLHGALIHTVDSCTFVVSNGGTQTFHIKAASEVERQSWVTALELAKAKSISKMESEEDEEEASGDTQANSEELKRTVKELQERLNNMQTCSELITKHGMSLQRLLTELERDQQAGSVTAEFDVKSKAVGERATLFRIASTAMVNACSEYLGLAQNQGQKWIRLLEHEREQRKRLEDMVEQLAVQHSHLEMAASAHASGSNGPVVSPSDDDDENEFYDCDNEGRVFVRRSSSDSSENGESRVHKPEPTTAAKPGLFAPAPSPIPVATESLCSAVQSEMALPVIERTKSCGKKTRRTKVPEKPNHPLNLWNIMKNCIGKDLSKIPMPVNFSEPLSMLQRLTEDYEYGNILDLAAMCEDPCEQLAYVTAFAITSYSSTSSRIGKPFNPLLGETYECDRTDDLGWRVISEQVSHHPPMVAQYCEGKAWRCWQEFTMTSKFRGKYLQVIPLGGAHVEFIASGNRYTWRKVTTTVHNIIVGKLWMDHHGDMEIVGQTGAAAGIRCLTKFIPYSYFTRDVQRRVKGFVVDANKVVRWTVTGTWDQQVDIAPVTASSSNISLDSSLFKNGVDNNHFKTGPTIVAWKRRPLPLDAEKRYGFTEFAAQLNEPEPGVAPTDSRLRPDQRFMENGQWDEANQEKLRLEDKQRIARRKREEEAVIATKQGLPYPLHEPLWFEKKKEEDSDGITHVYKHMYWECKEKGDWSQCPDIF